MKYVATTMKGDAARPYAVVDTGRFYLNVIGRYETFGAARAKARTLNKREAETINRLPPTLWSKAA